MFIGLLVKYPLFLSNINPLNAKLNPICHLLALLGGATIVVACWPLIPKFAGSNPAEAVGFLKGDKNPQHAFLRKGSKVIGPMSHICGM